MPKGNSQQLKELSRTRQFAKFWRPFEESSVRGYVLDVGPTFFLLSIVRGEIWFDGFECFRIKDVRKLEPDPYAAFIEAALKKRGERRPKRPRVGLGSIEDILLSGGRAFPLVTIHREQVDPDVCWIGRVVGVERGRVSLLEIGPDAKWDKKSSEYRLSEITRVNFGGDYEDALHLIGGDPPDGSWADSRVGAGLRRR